MDFEEMLEEAGVVMRTRDIDGYHILITGDAGTAIMGDGWSWSWLSDKPGPDGLFCELGPTAKELKSWTPAQIEDWGRKAIAAMNAQHAKMKDAVFSVNGQTFNLKDVFNNKPAKKRRHA